MIISRKKTGRGSKSTSRFGTKWRVLMVNFRSRNSRAAANTAVGLLLLQLGLRGLAIFLNEQGGNTYDVAGDINGPGYWWLLVHKSWTIEIVTRFSFWLLVPLGLFFL